MNMLKYVLSIKDNESKFVIIFFSLISYISFITFYLTYDITLSPDFLKYYDYYLYYNNDLPKTNLEQGHFYFFLTYLTTILFQSILSNLTTHEILNYSIHFCNNLFFLIGLIGFYKLLIFKKFQKFITILLLSIIIFMPASIVLKLSFKPEIIVFSFIGWLIYYFEKYLDRNQSKDVIKFILIFSILFTSKISLAFMLTLFFGFLILLNLKKVINKALLKYLLLFLFSTSLLLTESYIHNGKLIYEVDHDIQYDNKADLEFLTFINSEHLKNNPNRYFHKESFISITLFDTFNDFFLLYWNSEYTELNEDRKEFFTITTLNNDSFPNIRFDKENSQFRLTGNFDERWLDLNYVNETRMRFSFIASSIFYSLLMIFGIFFKKSRPYIISVFIGISTIAISALGLFGTNNFDPLVSDSVKTFYYAFFILLSFIFLLSEFFRKFPFGRKTICFGLLLFFLFMIGFPFTYTQEVFNGINYKISQIPLCNLNTFFINEIFISDFNLDCNKNFSSDEIFAPVNEVNYKNFSINLLRIPFLNLIIFICTIFYSRINHILKFDIKTNF